jgi:hypothetical protein
MQKVRDGAAAGGDGEPRKARATISRQTTATRPTDDVIIGPHATIPQKADMWDGWWLGDETRRDHSLLDRVLVQTVANSVR